MATVPVNVINPYGAAVINPYAITTGITSNTSLNIISTVPTDGSVVCSSTLFRRMSYEIVNGEPLFRFFEACHDGSKVRATLDVDPAVTPLEILKITQLMLVMREQSTSGYFGVEPIPYIRKHNLERHFRFDAV